MGERLTFQLEGLEQIELNRSHDPTHAWKALNERFESGEVGFFQAPSDPALSQIKESLALASELGDFSDCIFIGIGGSALGPQTLLEALSHRRTNGVRFHFFDNPDGLDWRIRTQGLEPKKTLVVGVTKSGGTFETAALFLKALEWLAKERWKDQVVAITDPKVGPLREIVQAQGLKSLSIAPSIGGRFSIFTPVGLFAGALGGLNMNEFLEGARRFRDELRESHPLFQLAQNLVSAEKEFSTHVFLPYSARLKSLGDWWVQLWGESLGKDGRGFTPLTSVGPSAQHSLLQLLRDGPNDKITVFLEIEKGSETPLPRFELHSSHSSYQLLGGQTMEKLVQVESQAIQKVLSKNNRPFVTLRVPELTETHFGEMTFAFAALTALSGTLMGVNPFDQPGVEEGKVYIKEALT